MYDQATDHARENLDRVLSKYRAGEYDVHAVVVAAKMLLKVMSPAEVEDREYHTVDLLLPISARCGARMPGYGRVCGRRADHVSPDHRSAEISWTEISWTDAPAERSAR